MGLFGGMEEEKSGAMTVANMPEMLKSDLMMFEKATTGIYISGHPMDDYRKLLKGTRVVSISALMAEESRYRDDDIVSIAGIVQEIKNKATRNGSLMAYVTVEDDTAAIELLCFSNVLSQYGAYIQANAPVVITGRLSLREEKEPQIVVNRARPISDFAPKETFAPPAELPQEGAEQQAKPQPVLLSGKLYLRLPTEDEKLFPKVKAMLSMFPGDSSAVLYFADTGARRGTRCALDSRLISELEDQLGKENVVVK